MPLRQDRERLERTQQELQLELAVRQQAQYQRHELVMQLAPLNERLPCEVQLAQLHEQQRAQCEQMQHMVFLP